MDRTHWDVPFVRLPMWVAFHPGLTPHDLKVYIAIAARAENTHLTAYPSLPRIAQDAGVSVRTVSTSVAKLEQLGTLTITRRPGKTPKTQDSNLYRLRTNPPVFAGALDAPGSANDDVGGSAGDAGELDPLELDDISYLSEQKMHPEFADIMGRHE